MKLYLVFEFELNRVLSVRCVFSTKSIADDYISNYIDPRLLYVRQYEVVNDEIDDQPTSEAHIIFDGSLDMKIRKIFLNEYQAFKYMEDCVNDDLYYQGFTIDFNIDENDK